MSWRTTRWFGKCDYEFDYCTRRVDRRCRRNVGLASLFFAQSFRGADPGDRAGSSELEVLRRNVEHIADHASARRHLVHLRFGRPGRPGLGDGDSASVRMNRPTIPVPSHRAPARTRATSVAAITVPTQWRCSGPITSISSRSTSKAASARCSPSRRLDRARRRDRDRAARAPRSGAQSAFDSAVPRSLNVLDFARTFMWLDRSRRNHSRRLGGGLAASRRRTDAATRPGRDVGDARRR